MLPRNKPTYPDMTYIKSAYHRIEEDAVARGSWSCRFSQKWGTMTSEVATAWAIFVAASILPLVVSYLARR